jgi:hypothetical protein
VGAAVRTVTAPWQNSASATSDQTMHRLRKGDRGPGPRLRAAAAQSLSGKTEMHCYKSVLRSGLVRPTRIDGQCKECMDEFDKAAAGIVSVEAALPESSAYWYHEASLAYGAR